MRFTHTLRAGHHAILVGVGTVLADDPQLRVRLVEGPSPQPVVVDTRLRTPLEAKLFSQPGRRIWLATLNAQQIRFFDLTGDLPARRSAWNAPSLVADPHFPAFRQQLERVQPLPQVPEYEQIATAIADRAEAAARGATNIPAALTQLDQKADALLEKRRWMLNGRVIPSVSEGPVRAGGAQAILQRAARAPRPLAHARGDEWR